MLTQPASGPYTATYNAVAIGLTEDGYKLRLRPSDQLINRSDTYGDTPIDYVWRGGSMRGMFTCMDFKTANLVALWPFNTFGILMNATTPIGILASGIAKALVLTATANTPAVAAATGKEIINTFTATRAVVPPEFEGEILFDSRLRTIPVELMLLPYTDSSNVVFGVKT